MDHEIIQGLILGSRFVLPLLIFIVAFEWLSRRTVQRNTRIYADYQKRADEVQRQSLQNQQEMISLLREIKDLLKT